MAELGNEEVLEFKWGKKRGIGGKKKDVQFYESFTYDGVEYTLFDSIYLYKEGEPEPYIGKLIKIWENPDKSKKVKVLWFFRPCEILNFLEGFETLDNELFLASGEGTGLSNVNPLEAIAGKCNVICISKDIMNPQPSDEELRMAEFVFYRSFDVGLCKIVDKIDDKIAGIEIKNIFNNLDSQRHVGVVKLGLDMKEVRGNVTESNGAVALLSEKSSQPIIEKSDGKSGETLVKENSCFKPSLGEKPLSSIGFKQACKSNDGMQVMSSDKTIPRTNVEENVVSKASLVKQRSSTKLSCGSGAGSEKGELAKTDDRRGNTFIEKTKLRPKIDSDEDKCEVVGGAIRQVKVELDVKSARDDKGFVDDKAFKLDVKSTRDDKGLVDDKVVKNEKHGFANKVLDEKIKNNVQNRRLLINDDDDVKTIVSSKDKHKLQRARDFGDVQGGLSKKLKLDKKPTKLSSDNLHKVSSTDSSNVAMEVTRRPDVDRSRWFKGFPWEERMKTAYEQGTLVLLENLDPSLTSQEVEDIIWHGFKESCTAKMIQQTAFSSPDSGQAFVIFKRKEAAELVVRKLDQGCLLMSNGRPLVGSIGNPCFREKKPVFYGHLVVDQLRMQMQRDMKDAVSTSHCSQPNNIEYDMAMEWCLLQERADNSWRRLHQRQGEELTKLKAKLKSKDL